MKKQLLNLTVIAVIGFSFSGCGAYRSSSGISVPENITNKSNIILTEKDFNDKECQTIKHIDASVKKLTLFHKDPTKEQVDYILLEKAKKLNANVIRNIKYKSGVGFTTWGYIDAEGDASKCNLNNKK
ncbi:hypothetical protein [Arcobacter sp. CECT 8985]|uniref:hypothetical protein n=1 Tax=Arcobacter sp. CECT 8985 TaxID=1935424 RepID=UPI00100B8F8C|nr:hypothetical protein [Arcobacter sp. CECT 8985]RXJ88091.1 hypothetical protein CRU93_00410 [Arcobacter sp. CECT 8985]